MATAVASTDGRGGGCSSSPSIGGCAPKGTMLDGPTPMYPLERTPSAEPTLQQDTSARRKASLTPTPSVLPPLLAR
eukprot:2332916-Prymnesium_polylepis.1